jgi:energy-coupling factor transporter ATP-binding protein EcfA2
MTNTEDAAASFPDGPTLLRNLATKIDCSWFTHLTEIAILHASAIPDDTVSMTLFSCFKDGSNIDTILTATPESACIENNADTENTSPTFCIEQIGPFSDFRKLSNELTLSPHSRITLVFGTNGSGKSSICLALRCLARHDAPSQLLHNAYTGSDVCSFQYRVSTSGTILEWKSSDGFGVHHGEIAYYDGSVAFDLINNPASPDQIVELAPFGLEVFRETGRLLRLLESKCNTELSKLRSIRNDYLSKLRSACQNIEFLSGLTDTAEQDRWLIDIANRSSCWDPDTDENITTQLRNQIDDLNARRRPEQKKLIERSLNILRASREMLVSQQPNLTKLLTVNEPAITNKVVADTEARNTLLSTSIDESVNVDAFIELLSSANKIMPFDSDIGNCPLCKQELHVDEIFLFQKYQSILSNTILTEIAKANKLLDTTYDLRQSILRSTNTWDASSIRDWIGEDFVSPANDLANELRAILRADRGCFASDAKYAERVKDVHIFCRWISSVIRKLESKLAEIESGQANIVLELHRLSDKLKLLEVHRFRANNHDLCNQLATAAADVRSLMSKIESAGWQDKRTKLTRELRSANEQITKSQFIEKLDREYKQITNGLGLDHFGVRITLDAAAQAISINPVIGHNNSRLTQVLSEGEQRLHSIALFFAEASIRIPSVLVFDDPSVSFDYNYTDGVVNRLIDFMRAHRDTQVLVFTHSWEFYLKVRDGFRKYDNAVDPHNKLELEMYELDRCATLDAHNSTTVDNRKQNILRDINSLPDYPTSNEAGDVCKNIRLYIEQIINHYHFNGSREHFRTRPQASLSFERFRKLRPLSEAHAITMSRVTSSMSDWLHATSGGPLIVPTKQQLRESYNLIRTIHKELASDFSADE